MLLIKNLSVSINNKKILEKINLIIKPGEIHVLMGPNGAGKSTLAMNLIHSKNVKYLPRGEIQLRRTISNFQFQMNGEDMVQLSIEERARKGLFVTFQNPIEIEGISVLSFLRAAYNSVYPTHKISLKDFKENVKDALKKVMLDESFLQRYINNGFSGGEKKRFEIAQMLILKPKFAVLDEIDSGLDIDNLKIISKLIKKVSTKNKIGILLITHQPRIFKYLRPDYLHVLNNRKIVDADCNETIKKIEKYGFGSV